MAAPDGLRRDRADARRRLGPGALAGQGALRGGAGALPVTVFRIFEAKARGEIASARDLFLEYAAGLGINLGYQGFSEEIARLPGEYAPPRGRLLLAEEGGRLVGCAGLRPLKDEIAEMKR